MLGPSSIDNGYAVGVEGAPYGLNEHTGYADINPISTGGLVRAGSFVWLTEDEVGFYGWAKASATPLATEEPFGFVRRTQIYSANDLNTIGGSLMIPDDKPLSVAIKGSFFARSLTAATRGQSVYAMTNPTNVSDTARITTAAAGETITNGIETPWEVLIGGEAGDLIVISRR